jgi:hypothetical protein
LNSNEKNNVGSNTTPDVQPLDRSQLSAAVDSLLEQANHGQTVIPPDLSRPAFELLSANRTPQSLGIPWLDTMLAGGLADGEVFLFLGPTGGGKTTLSTQIAWSRAMQRSHTIYITYDEPLEGYINNRFYSLMTGVPRPDLEKRAIAEMPPDIQHRFQAWREAYGDFLHVYDGSGAKYGNGGIEDIIRAARCEIDQGRRPSLVIVDWVQCAVLKGMKQGGGSAREIAGQMDDYARQFAAICQDQRIQGMLVQQLAAIYQPAWNIDINHKMAEACSTLGKHCHHAVGIGRLTPDGEGLMISSKGVTPSASRPPQPVRLNGAMNRFEIPDSIPYYEQIEQLAAGYKAPSPERANQTTADHCDPRSIRKANGENHDETDEA